MFEIGTTLKAAREEKGITLVEAEEGTKIKRNYLEALETEDFDELPGQVYAIGFLKTYARYLGLDTPEINTMTEGLKQTLEPSTVVDKRTITRGKMEAKVRNGGRNGRPGRPLLGRPRLKFSLTLLIILLVFLSVIFAFGKGEREKEGGFLVTEKPPVEDAAFPGPASTPDEPEEGFIGPAHTEFNVNEINLELYVRKDKCWMQVVVDGQNAFSGTLKAGEQRAFIGQDSIYVHLGNAGTVEAFRNGQSIGYLGDWGQILRKTFTLDDPLEPPGA